jgi:predicted metalloprotease
MKWEGHRQSERVEDLRGSGGGNRPRLGGKGLSLGGIVIALLASWIFGINPMTVLGLMDGGGALPQTEAPAKPLAAQTEAERFVTTVLADTEDVWAAYFAQRQQQVEPPRLRLFREPVQTACGRGEAAMGPFYCPGDEYVYLDLGFFDTLRGQLGAPGDFAQAYVIAHEVGHHLQHKLGISGKVQQARQRLSEAQGNQLSVRLELQADCFAGVWAHHSQRGKGWLEAGDLEEAMNAAARIGDDVLQKAARGTVVPESFTHGTAAQRQRWFQNGLQSGRIEACDSFGAKTL